MNNNDYQKMIEKINQQEKQLLNQFQNNNDIIEKIKENAKIQKLAALLGVNNG
jgi:Ni,Fe-hydrogenase III large subunit